MDGLPYLTDERAAAYQRARRPDPRIAAPIEAALGDAVSIVNVGAGTGNYEPRGRSVVAVEPQRALAALRPPGSGPSVEACAEQLPFRARAFDAALAIATVHHWHDLNAGLAELQRVARRRVVILTWDPAFAEVCWITRDAFPPLPGQLGVAPPLEEITAQLDGEVRVEALPVPHDCIDGMLHAYWRRPEAFLEPSVRAGIAWFDSRPGPVLAAEVERLADDVREGRWHACNGALTDLDAYDCGYRLVVAERPAPPAPRCRAREATAPITVEVLDDPAGLPMGWDAMVRGGGGTAFHTARYLRAYHASPPADFVAARYLVARDHDGAPAGGLAAFLLDDPDPRQVAGHTLLGRSGAGPALLSPSWHCYAGEFPARPQTATVSALWMTLRDAADELGARTVGMINLPESDRRVGDLTAAGVAVVPCDARYRIAKSPTGVRAVLQASSDGREHQRHLRRAAELGVTASVAPPSDPASIATLAHLCAINAQRLGSALYAEARVAAFVTALGNECTIFLLHHEDRPIGGAFCLTDERSLHAWYGATAVRKLGSCSPYAVLLEKELAETDRRRLPVYEGGRRVKEFKVRRGMRELVLVAALERL